MGRPAKLLNGFAFAFLAFSRSDPCLRGFARTVAARFGSDGPDAHESENGRLQTRQCYSQRT